jgi:ribosomal protein S18 acetylase RimI-like enzyme
MNIRPATLSDAPLSAQMNLRLIQDEGHRNPMTVQELQQRMTGFLFSNYHAMIFEQGPAALGYALYRYDTDAVYLRQFWIDPHIRRQGIGRRAFEWLRVMQWKDKPRIRLDVLVCNPAGIAFWRSVGFGDYCITMEMELKPGILPP